MSCEAGFFVSRLVSSRLLQLRHNFHAYPGSAPSPPRSSLSTHLQAFLGYKAELFALLSPGSKVYAYINDSIFGPGWAHSCVSILAVGQPLFARLFRYVEDAHVHTKYEKNHYQVNQGSTRFGMPDATHLETPHGKHIGALGFLYALINGVLIIRF